MTPRLSVIAFITALILGLAACGEKPADETLETTQSAAATGPQEIPRTASTEGASVFFITPADGNTVSNPINIEFGIAGMDVRQIETPPE